MKKQIFAFFQKYFGFSYNEIKGTAIVIIGLFLVISYRLARNLFFFHNSKKIIDKNKTVEINTDNSILDKQLVVKKSDIQSSKNRTNNPIDTKKNINSTNLSKQKTNKEHYLQNFFDINKISAYELKAYFNFNDIIAKRIIKFREALGGFVNPEQLLEVYGINKNDCKTKLNKFYISKKNPVRQISINTGSLKELVRHPYIDYAAALEIVRFREKRKEKIFLKDLKNIKTIEKTIEKTKDYLKE